MRVPALLAAALSVAFGLAAGPVLAHGPGGHKPSAAQPMIETDFGRTGDPKRVSRTVTIDMADTMRFTPAALQVRKDETIRFVVRNRGKVMHEMVIGTMKELAEHAEQMKKHPDMEHDEPYMAHVAPGKEAAIVWQFTKAGEFHFGCLVAGHFDAGMTGTISVRP